MAEVRFCEKCQAVKDSKNFYRSNNLEKFPDNGYLNICKDCLTRHVDNFDSKTYLDILELVDVPYIPDVWNKLLQKFGKDPSKLTGSSILGRYLATMRIKQYKDYRWKDNEFLKQLAESKVRQSMEVQGYDPSDIAKIIDSGAYITPQPQAPQTQASAQDSFQEPDDEEQELTADDIKYLRIKWGKTYRPSEWVQLETLYTEMMNSYDIQTAGHKDNLKLLCKASLKANQLMDLGDIDGAQKATRMYDTLMKQGNFTAVQNKTEKGDFVNSIGELVRICEEQGFIPQYYTDGPKDSVDKIILDMQHYTRELVIGELGLGNLIENAIQGIKNEQAAIAEAASGSEADSNDAEMDALFNYEDDNNEVTAEDVDEFSDFLLEQEGKDKEYFEGLEG